MTKFMALILAGAAMQIAAISPGAPASGVEKMEMEMDYAGRMASDKVRRREDGPAVLRRDTSLLQEQTAAASTAHHGAQDTGKKVLEMHKNKEDMSPRVKRLQHQAAQEAFPDESAAMQAVTFIFGDKILTPALAFVFVAMLGAVCYGAYAFRMKQQAEQQAVKRRQMMRMRAAAAPASEACGSDARSSADTDGSVEKGEGKGIGKVGKGFGKTIGKTSIGKGAKGREPEKQSAWDFLKSLVPGGPVKPAAGKASGKGLKGLEQESTLVAKAGSAGLGFQPRLSVSSVAGSSVSSRPESLAGKGDGKNGKSQEALAAKGSGQNGKASSVKAKVTSFVTGAPPVALAELMGMMKAVDKIQASWRTYKAGRKPPQEKQRITVVCDVLEGSNMPNVNQFGGCDPFIECRIVRGDPTNKLRGEVDMEPLFSTQTDVKRNEMMPSWRQRLALNDVIYEKGMYVQLVLWDYSLVRNQPIGHVALPLDYALAVYKPKCLERFLTFKPLAGGADLNMTAKVSAQFSFWQAHNHRLVVESGSLLPKASGKATISSYIEARIVQNDPRKAPFERRPVHTECLWSGCTNVVNENVDPRWQQEFDFTLPYLASSLWLQLVLWDTDSKAPIGHSVTKISQAQSGNVANLVAHNLSLEALPESKTAADLSHRCQWTNTIQVPKLSVHMGFKLA